MLSCLFVKQNELYHPNGFARSRSRRRAQEEVVSIENESFAINLAALLACGLPIYASTFPFLAHVCVAIVWSEDWESELYLS